MLNSNSLLFNWNFAYHISYIALFLMSDYSFTANNWVDCCWSKRKWILPIFFFFWQLELVQIGKNIRMSLELMLKLYFFYKNKKELLLVVEANSIGFKKEINQLIILLGKYWFQFDQWYSLYLFFYKVVIKLLIYGSLIARASIYL